MSEPGSTTIKGERLSAKLKSLPGTNEPYESSVNKEIGKCVPNYLLSQNWSDAQRSPKFNALCH